MTENTPPIQSGSLVTVTYEDREFRAIVIDPNGLGPGQPSVGFGFMMAQKHIGIPQPTLTKRVIQEDGDEWFKTPSGMRFRVIHLLGVDGNNYKVIEVSEWFDPHSALQIVTLRIMAEDNRATQIGVRRFSKEKAPPTQKIVTG